MRLLPDAADLPQGVGTIGFADRAGRLQARRARTAQPWTSGTPGELQIDTPFGMLGYLDDPALTAASFSDGFFRTGDLARLRADGRVELVGRIKEHHLARRQQDRARWRSRTCSATTRTSIGACAPASPTSASARPST